MSAKTVEPGDWFVPGGGRGRVAHRLWKRLPRERWPLWPYCSQSAKEVGRPATPEDRRCRRCEERSNG